MINYLAPKKVLTPAEYFSKFVNFYGESLGAASGIQTTTESPTDTTTPGEVPSIYDDPAGEKDLAEEGRLKAERILSDPSGGLQFFDTTDAVHDTMESFDFSEALGFGGDMVNADSFFGSMVDTPYGTKQSFKPGLGFTLGLGAISGGMLAAPMALGHALNMQGAAITAGKVKSTLDPVTGKFTGGALMEINGIKVYRDPGSFIYNGSRRGMSNAQLKAMEGFQRHGYVGDWSETANPSITDSFGRVRTDGLYSQNGNVGYLYKITGDSKAGIGVGGDYDPATGSFKFAGGGGSAMGSKQAAEIAVGDLHAKYGLTEASFSYRNVAKARQIAKATGQRWDNVLDGLARQQAGAPSTYGGTTGSLASAKSSYAPGAAYKRTGMADFFTDEARKQRASEIAKGQAQKAAAEAAAAAAKVKAGEQVAGGSKSDPSGGGVKDGGGAFGGLTDRQKDSAGRSSAGGTGGNPGDKSTWAEGGRVGMQAGGEAGFAQRPEFVGGNETPTNRQSIADNVPREVPEGTFVINAAAVDFAGREDIEKMVRKAYAKAGQGTQTGTAQEVDIAVSNGEVLIPPHIAKIIGYDRLNKINNRGKKEISRRQEERQQAAGGGFIGRKKFAEGDMVLPKSKPKRVNHSGLADVELRADLEVYIQNDPLARLGFNLYEKGDVDVKAIVLPARRKVRVGVGGVYTPKDRQRDPGPAARRFEGFAQKQGLTKSNNKVAGIHYFEGDNVNYGRAEGPLTLLHELRHHAMRHLNKKYKVPLPELSFEESMFDAQDYVNRLQARKVKPSIRSKPKSKDLEIRQKNMYMSPSTNKELATYQSIAEQVLQDRKVPPRTKSKEVEGFFTRGMKLLGL